MVNIPECHFVCVCLANAPNLYPWLAQSNRPAYQCMYQVRERDLCQAGF